MRTSCAIAVVVCRLLLGACSTFGIHSGTSAQAQPLVEGIATKSGDEDIDIRRHLLLPAAELPDETLAVVRFTGAPNPNAIDAVTWTLQRGLDGTAWTPTAVPVAFFYGPPWTLPFLRRNGVAAPLSPAR